MDAGNILKEECHDKFSQTFKQHLTKEDFIILTSSMTKDIISKKEDGADKNLQWICSLEDLEDKNREQTNSIIELLIAYLSYPLMRRITIESIRDSFIEDDISFYEIIFYSGFLGMKKGLRKYNPDKDSGKSIHYISRWFKVYAKREVLRNEAGKLGIKYTHYEKLKKIAAVRMKISSTLNRTPTNEEILNYFHSGHADMTKGEEVTKANSSISLDDIIEQEYLYKSYFVDSTSKEF